MEKFAVQLPPLLHGFTEQCGGESAQNAQHQQLFRQFVSDVEQLTLDGNGRFLIPRRYMKMANIESAVRFIGMDDTIEIWNADTANGAFMDADAFAQQLEDLMTTPGDTDTNG